MIIKSRYQLRTQLEQHLVRIEDEDHFLMQRFPIPLNDEASFRIHQVVENNMVAMKSHSRVLSACLPSPGNHPSPNWTHDGPDPEQWRAIYRNTGLLRGQCFLPHGPRTGSDSLLRLKPNWRPNNILSDDAKIHVEMSHHQDSSEYLNDKMYDMNAIGNLPFVNFALGFRHDRQQLTVMNTETMSIFFYYKLPCVVHVFNPDMIEAEPRFINEIDKILEQTVDDKKYKQLCCLFDKYGHGYATKVVLGGYQIRVQREQSDETYDEDEREERVNGNFELACNEVGLGLGLDWSRIRTSIGQQLMNSLTRDSSVIGGNSLESDIN